MRTTVELWDIEAGNIVGSFESTEAGLDVVRTLLATYGRRYAKDLSLSRRDGEGPSQVIAEGDQLVALLVRPTEQSERKTNVLTPSD